MRTAFSETLEQLAEGDERIWLLTGDLGYSVLERFAARFPDRFVNAGVAEQNMTSVAAGLALSGKIVFTYSIANFPVMRCLEQIRNDVAYHNLNVKIVAVGGGLAYGGLGYSHHAVEDLAIMRTLPNMAVLAPADPVETRALVRAAVERAGPCYIRLGKAGEPVLHSPPGRFEIGKASLVRNGNDVTLISTGAALELALEAHDQLAGLGCSARVLSMHTVEPIDRDAILAAASETRAMITIEEHGPGGLGAVVATILARDRSAHRFETICLCNVPTIAGSQSYLRKLGGLEASKIVEVARGLLKDS